MLYMLLAKTKTVSWTDSRLDVKVKPLSSLIKRKELIISSTCMHGISDFQIHVPRLLGLTDRTQICIELPADASIAAGKNMHVHS